MEKFRYFKMKKFKLLVLAIITVVASSLIFSCKKDKDSKPIISISPGALHLYGNVGDLITFKVSVTSDVALSKVVIKGQLDNETPTVLLDTAILTKSTSFTYFYRIPASLAGKSIVFIFRAENQNGIANENFTRLYVNAPQAVVPVALTESAGHRMYSNLSLTNQDAYNLETKIAENSMTADTASRDIQDMSASSSTLSLSWKSPAGGKFVVFNSFDYANATDSSTISAYSSGVKYSILYNLQLNDIIITKLGSVSTNKYVVMRITDIVEAVGKDGDYYEFTIKK
ncbi:MAG: hypothetical protein K0S53_3071 [Bacteroidetes bacterium]|jgi:hypothetical protein|nr:hypothetical protein [Bacteroidota bacterium]MDF2453573.1 hypothetical protein [Bacteroidota bacterium]